MSNQKAAKLVKAFAYRFPSLTPAAERLEQPTTVQGLRSLKNEILNRRVEYWTRKIYEFPYVIADAKVEARELYNGKLRKPSTWTWGDLATVCVWGVQIGGCFVLGEMAGRGSITGYPVGERPIDSYHAH